MSTTIGCVTGVFDLFQVAHLDLLRRAAERCERLVVVLPTDAKTVALGLPSPVVPDDERAAIVAEMDGVDAVVVLGGTVDADLTSLLRRLGADGLDLVLSHQLDLPGTREAAHEVGLAVETVHGLRMSASELLRLGRGADAGDDALNSVA